MGWMRGGEGGVLGGDGGGGDELMGLDHREGYRR